MRKDTLYLQYISESIRLVQDYVAGVDGEPVEFMFYDEQRTQDAVMHRMETLADATSHLSDALRSRHPEIEWRQIADFRNVLAHGYAGVRLEQVWQAIVLDLPILKSVVDQELALPHSK